MMAAGGYKRRRWSAEDDAQLAALVADGWTQRRVGEVIERSEYAVSARAAVLNLRNPEAMKRNSAAAQRAFWADKSANASTRRRISDSWTPERRAMQAGVARETTAKHPYRPPGPEGRQRITAAVKASHQRRKAWIPEDLRKEYSRLARNHSAAFARAEITRIVAERDARMTPFERQMAKVRAGAGIVEIMPIRAAESAHSLTGCSMAMVAYG